MARASIALALMAHNSGKHLPIIARNLFPRIDAAVILTNPPNDDDTMEMAKRWFGDLPGEIRERPWPDSFSAARNEIIDLARPLADYVLWLDPDDPLEGTIPDELGEPLYSFTTHYQNITYDRPHLIRSDVPVTWKGRVHEYLDPGPYPTTHLDSAIVRVKGISGGRERMVNHDIPALLTDLREDPTNARSCFYLAQTYRDIGETDLAIRFYVQRAGMVGFCEETYFAMYQAGRLLMGKDNDEAERWLLRAFAYRPTRTESLRQLSWLYHCKGEEPTAAMIAWNMCQIPPSSDVLFVETS